MSIEDYINLKKGLWAETTCSTAVWKLKVCEQISPELDPRDIFDGLKFKQKKLYTIKTYLIIAAGYEKFLKGTEHIKQFLKDNAYVFRHAYQEKTRRMSEEDYATILKEVENSPNLYNLMILLGRCGLRKSEALEAKWSDIDTRRHLLKVQGKGNKLRHVPILSSWLKQCGVVGSDKIVGSRNGCFSYFKRSPFSFHDFRAFYATKIMNTQGCSIKDAQLMLGHTSIATTQKYLRADLESAKVKILFGGAA